MPRLFALLVCSYSLVACATVAGPESLRGGPTDPGAAESTSPVFLALADPADAGHHDHSDHVHEAPADDVTYVCPMHPEVTSHEQGRCPKCGMKLAPKKPQPKDAKP